MKPGYAGVAAELAALTTRAEKAEAALADEQERRKEILATVWARAEKAEQRAVFCEERMEVQSQDRARLALALEKAERERDAARDDAKATKAYWLGVVKRDGERIAERSGLVLKAEAERDAALATVERLKWERDNEVSKHAKSVQTLLDCTTNLQRERATVERMRGALERYLAWSQGEGDRDDTKPYEGLRAALSPEPVPVAPATAPTGGDGERRRPE